MKPLTIAFLDRSLVVEAPASLAADLSAFFALAGPDGGRDATRARVVITEEAPGQFGLTAEGEAPATGLGRGEVLRRLTELAGKNTSPSEGVVLHSAAVGWGEKSVLLIGQDGDGKSSLAAWFIEHGFAYVADDRVAIVDDAGTVAGLAGPLLLRRLQLAHIGSLPTFRKAPTVLIDEDWLAVQPEPTWQAPAHRQRCGFLLFVKYELGAAFSVLPLNTGEAAVALTENTRTPVEKDDPHWEWITALAESTPAARITYGNYWQIDGVLDYLARVAVDTDSNPGEVERFISGIAGTSIPKTFPVPERSDRKFTPKMTIGMATYDDFDGVYFTLQALRLYHPEILDDVEFIVVDNHPDGPAGQFLKDFEEFIPNLRYIPAGDIHGTMIKGRIFEEAAGEYVLCLDCHVMVVPGALMRLLEYFDRHPQTRDLLQGPVLMDDLEDFRTHFEPQWGRGFFGNWSKWEEGRDPEGKPFDIVAQNTGLFACRRDAFPGFNKHFRGYVLEEGYLHRKFRNAGGRTLCLPFLRCIHRMRRVNTIPYPMRWDERLRNSMIALRELGMSTADMEAHFREYLGERVANKLIATAKQAVKDLPD